jgi:CBS domain-containing protein
MTMTDEDKKGKPVVRAEEDDTAYRLARMMEEFNVGCVVITAEDEHDPIGIVTDRDLALAIGTSGFDSKALVAQDIMRSPVETVEAGTSLINLAAKMAQSEVRRFPVTQDGELVDIVTLDDLVVLVSEVLGKFQEVIEASSPVKIGKFMDSDSSYLL